MKLTVISLLLFVAIPEVIPQFSNAEDVYFPGLVKPVEDASMFSHAKEYKQDPDSEEIAKRPTSESPLLRKVTGIPMEYNDEYNAKPRTSNPQRNWHDVDAFGHVRSPQEKEFRNQFSQTQRAYSEYQRKVKEGLNVTQADNPYSIHYKFRAREGTLKIGIDLDLQ
ncbi:hypothetical protein PFISCL1PPCAC_26292 [Pristionchus fissidentatus]|uniref:Uncharacterized protein n=1 Tax=Pristionchus fissidentatus TaxID=1538716 RepID=A0AAV5WWK8_9BILA|nr:hypothetical protein PFISCL1PPCAC_26292 [Pristionchus fissidentatus]